MVEKRLEAIENQLIRIETKMDGFIEKSAANDTSIKYHRAQLTGLWALLVAMAGWLVKRGI